MVPSSALLLPTIGHHGHARQSGVRAERRTATVHNRAVGPHAPGWLICLRGGAKGDDVIGTIYTRPRPSRVRFPLDSGGKLAHNARLSCASVVG